MRRGWLDVRVAQVAAAALRDGDQVVPGGGRRGAEERDGRKVLEVCLLLMTGWVQVFRPPDDLLGHPCS
jgi:hypothetical protein